MGFTKINHDEAKSSHQSFYDGNFEVMPMERCNYWDFFPTNIIFAIFDMPFLNTGNWSGLVSTDGHKAFITRNTRNKWTNIAKHKKTFEFKVDDLNHTKFGPVKVTMRFDKKIKGLTMLGVNPLIKLVSFFPFVVGIFVPMFIKGKVLQIRVDDQFENKDQFRKLLEK